MWPLTAGEVLDACGLRPPAGLDLDRRYAGVVVGERQPDEDEILFAIRHEGYDAHEGLAQALEAGAPLAVVASDWGGLAGLPPALRARCALADEPLGALRRLAAWMRRRLPCPVVAVGGSNGKTTTKDMLAAMLSGNNRRALATEGTNNGFIGLPLSLADRSLSATTMPHAIVLEIGVDAPGAMDDHVRMAQPGLVALTALGPEHLRGLGTPERAAAEELRLLEAPGARRVLLLDDPALAREGAGARPGDVWVVDERLVPRLLGARMPTPDGVALLRYRVEQPSPFGSRVYFLWEPPGQLPGAGGSLDVPMPGRHAAGNAALAVACSLSLGLTPREIAEGWAGFTPPAMRAQISVLPGGCTLIDDAFNASPSSVAAALELLDHPAWAHKPRVLLLGDMLDLGGHEVQFHQELIPLLRARTAGREGDVLLLFGDAMGEVHAGLEAGLQAGLEASKPARSRHLPSSADPAALLDDPLPPLQSAVVLVKGSRGMRLERATARLRALCAEAHPFPARASASPRAVTIGLCGPEARPGLAGRLAAMLGRFQPGPSLIPDGNSELSGTGGSPSPGISLALLTAAQLMQGAGSPRPALDVAVFCGLSVTGDGDAERTLAALAQPFLSLAPGAIAVLPAEGEAAGLIAELVPAGVKIVRWAAPHALHGSAASGPTMAQQPPDFVESTPALMALPSDGSAPGEQLVLTDPSLGQWGLLRLPATPPDELDDLLCALCTVLAAGAPPSVAGA
jgi:UDP-N-acetylmuramoyl-tripeptide--D-alanyl-D-alanine ligase